MAKRISVTQLNTSSIDIINTIRANAGLEYQSLVPVITSATEIPRVGEVLFGYPALANQFLNSLVNRIALVVTKSAVFNNPYKDFNKGFLEFGETVEDNFVQIAKVMEFSAEKAEAREFKRYIPDVKTIFHTMNWRALYPVSVEDVDLKRAFLSADGVQDLIDRIVASVYTAAEYDSFLLVKYLIIKAISHGHAKMVEIGGTMDSAAIAFRGTSNKLQFMADAYNELGVLTTTPKDRQAIIMGCDYNAAFDVSVLSAAFNMDKAMFMGKLKLIDDFTSFDNARFAEIRANSDMVEEVTSDELALMAKVKTVLVDEDWFQIYDNEAKFTEKYISSGMRWNYFYHTWRTISYSPFANIVAFVDSSATTDVPSTITVTVADVSKGDKSAIYTLIPADSATLRDMRLEFVQDGTSTQAGIAVHPYGAVIVPIVASPGTQPSYTAKAKIGTSTYTASAAIYVDTDSTPSTGHDATVTGDTITLALDT